MDAFLWLDNDLRRARDNYDVKWVILSSHRPSICTNPVSEDCSRNLFTFRKYDALLEKYKVDMKLNGHIHSYNRLAPMRSMKVVGQGEGPITLIIGHSGTDHNFLGKDQEELFRSPIVDKVHPNPYF